MTDDEIRNQLVAVFMELWREEAGDLGDPATVTEAGHIALAYAAALLPVVRRAQAAAIKSAANDVHMPYGTRMDLRERADALDAPETALT